MSYISVWSVPAQCPVCVFSSEAYFVCLSFFYVLARSKTWRFNIVTCPWLPVMMNAPVYIQLLRTGSHTHTNMMYSTGWVLDPSYSAIQSCRLTSISTKRAGTIIRAVNQEALVAHAIHISVECPCPMSSVQCFHLRLILFVCLFLCLSKIQDMTV